MTTFPISRGRWFTRDSASPPGSRPFVMPVPQAKPVKQSQEFRLHVPKSFILSDFGLGPFRLYLILRVHADVKTGKTWISLGRIERLLRVGRDKRQKFQNELKKGGWISWEQELKHGKRGRLIFTVKIDSWPGVKGEL